MDHRGTRSRSICTRGRWKPLETRPINSLGSCTAFWSFPSNGADGAHFRPISGGPSFALLCEGQPQAHKHFFSSWNLMEPPGHFQAAHRGALLIFGGTTTDLTFRNLSFFLPSSSILTSLLFFSLQKKETTATPSSLDSSAKRSPFSFTASHQGKPAPALSLPLVYPNPGASTASCACVGGRRQLCLLACGVGIFSILLLLAGRISRRGSIAA